MSYDFSADDIFAMAEQIERNGAKFYRTAAENVTAPAAKELLTGLAAMEDEHQKTFALLRVELAENEKAATVFDPQDESTLYLRALADVRVFFEKSIDLTSMREILKAAVEAEKDSIVFYLGMKELVADKLGKDKIDTIIKEEMRHIRILSTELVAMQK